MEEILASIRRIIEDSDVSRHPMPPISPRGEVAEFRRPLVAEEAEKADNRKQKKPDQPVAAKGDVFPEEPALRGVISEPGEPTSDIKTEEDGDDPILDAQNDDHRNDEWVPPVSASGKVVLDKVENDAASSVMESKAEAMNEDLSPAVGKPTAVASPSKAGGATHILSEVAERQVAAAFQDLSHAVHSEPRRSFDDIAADILRPMLQDWLDSNLPDLVERLVREEIERVVRS